MPTAKARLQQAYVSLFRRRLASVDALPQLAVLGLLSGLVTGAVILLFRAAIEWPLGYWLTGPDTEGFEELPGLVRCLLPLSGAIALGVLLHRLAISDRKVGVTYVMERLNFHQGHIPLRSALIQFVTGVVTIVTGQSAGREGPAVHLGAACSSLLGQYMRLPNNSIRTLVACGTAAAIAASFNTPIAGVIFAMEVVLMEYTIAGFTPVILASVTGAVITRAVYGAAPAFSVPSLTLQTLWEIPYILWVALVTGIASVLFVRLLTLCMRFDKQSMLLRLPIAGLIMVPFAWFVPQVMGIGYDTVNLTLLGEGSIGLLLAIAMAKLVVTAVTVGLGMPSGLIGPTLVIGATLGGALGLLGAALSPTEASSMGFYAMLGMGAMMGAVLQAPLAALMALLELTQNPNIILPGMLAITTATMVAYSFFDQRSIFMSILRKQGLDFRSSPVLQALRRVGVGAIMERRIRRVNRRISVEHARRLLRTEPLWLIVDGEKGPAAAMPAVDLARHLEELKLDDEQDTAAGTPEEKSDEKTPELDLMAIPAQRRDIASIHYQATLQEALDRFIDTGAEALYVERTAAPMIQRVLGLITRADIENYYQYKGR